MLKRVMPTLLLPHQISTWITTMQTSTVRYGWEERQRWIESLQAATILATFEIGISQHKDYWYPKGMCPAKSCYMGGSSGGWATDWMEYTDGCTIRVGYISTTAFASDGWFCMWRETQEKLTILSLTWRVSGSWIISFVASLSKIGKKSSDN